MKKRAIITAVSMIALAGGLSPVWADGFKIPDLIPIKEQFWSIFDASAHHAEEPTNFRMSCCGIDDDQYLMIAIDRHVDEEGQENRTDEAYLSGLDALGRKFGFEIETINVSPATGRLLHGVGASIMFDDETIHDWLIFGAAFHSLEADHALQTQCPTSSPDTPTEVQGYELGGV